MRLAELANQTGQFVKGMYQFEGYVLPLGPSNFFKIARTSLGVIIFQLVLQHHHIPRK